MKLTELVVKLSTIRRVTHDRGSEETGSCWFGTDSHGEFVEWASIEELLDELRKELAEEAKGEGSAV